MSAPSLELINTLHCIPCIYVQITYGWQLQTGGKIYTCITKLRLKGYSVVMLGMLRNVSSDSQQSVKNIVT